MRMWLGALGLLLAASLAAQDVPAVPTATALVPVVGTVPGVNNVRWQTDVELVNDTGSEAVVALELPTSPGALAIIISLAPGQSQRFPNVAGDAFGIETVLSPLLVSTMGRRSVTIRAAAVAVSAEGVAPPQPLTVEYAPADYPLRSLDGLSFSDEFRTNVGLLNLGEKSATFVLALRRVGDRNLAVASMRVPPVALVHVPVQSIFPLISKGSDFSLVVETSAPDTHVYASVIDNATSAGRFISPRPATQ